MSNKEMEKEESQDKRSAEDYFTFDKTPVVEQGVVDQNVEPSVTGILTVDLDDIVDMAASRVDKELLEESPITAVNESLSFALQEYKGAKYQGHVDAPTWSYLTNLVLSQLEEGGRKKKATQLIASNLIQRLDKIASDLQEQGREDLAKIVDAATNSVEAYYRG